LAITKDEAARLRVGLVGAGYIAKYHAQALASLAGVQVVGVADRAVGRAQALASSIGTRGYDSVNELLRVEHPDVVHVLVPPDLHGEAVRPILQAGVHAYLEKPMCTTARECGELMDLADQGGARLGVAHNFLFAEPYERLRRDVTAGLFGPIESLTITWNKELGQLHGGPFDAWMLRQPEHIMVEVGPHLVTQVLDLLGQSPELQVDVSQPLNLPTGVRFWQRWRAWGDVAGTAVDLRLGFGPGYTEHRIEVRGRLATAVVDFERNTYILNRHRPLDPDFDRWMATQAEAVSACKQAWSTLAGYVLGKAKLTTHGGNPYTVGIRRAAQAFYASLRGASDRRISPTLARESIAICETLGHAGRSEPRENHGRLAKIAPLSEVRPNTLVLGATGFIGREVVRHCVAANRGLRLLVRSPSRLPADLRGPGIEVMEGDAGRTDDLQRALLGITHVVHLARANVKTWDEYQQHEIEMTRQVARTCRAAGVQRLVYTGTIDSYYAGRAGDVITEDTPLDPQIERRNLYARAKAASEAILVEEHRRHGLPVVIVRPGIVIGQGGNPCHWGVGMWRHDSICQMWGRGENKLPLVLVEDVARGVLAALVAPGVDGQSFNLVSDPLLSARDYLDELERAGRLKIDRRATPIARFFAGDVFKWAVKVAVQFPDRRVPSYRDWQSRTQQALFDCSRAKVMLGWRPTSDRATLVHQGIAQPVAEWLGKSAEPDQTVARDARAVLAP
jgi:nucleoside-diphosphate-sugar epimerase/predicted dehydrogenase